MGRRKHWYAEDMLSTSLIFGTSQVLMLSKWGWSDGFYLIMLGAWLGIFLIDLFYLKRKGSPRIPLILLGSGAVICAVFAVSCLFTPGLQMMGLVLLLPTGLLGWLAYQRRGTWFS